MSGKRAGIHRRDFLKYTALGAATAALSPRLARAGDGWDDDDRGSDGDHALVQSIDGARLYMTHYALFEEPDPNVPPALYFDAATGAPTDELTLVPPLSQRVFARRRGRLSAPSDTSKLLPYVVEPPGFPPLPAPAPVVGFVQQVTGLDAQTIAASTGVLLVAIGQFVGSGPTTGRREGRHFEVERTVTFEVRIRTGFLFTPPVGVPAPSVGLLTGYLDFGLLHQLIQLPPPPDPSELVVYNWQAPMKLSTRHRFVRATANEPAPVADPFPTGLAEVRFEGSPIDRQGRYTIVGSASAVPFQAPPELVEFLFGQTVLTDVELAVEESGTLTRG
jgi:hypothetical protein